MSEVSEEVKERTRKNLACILNRMGSFGQVNVAEAIGLHETSVSKMKSSGELERFAKMLSVLGLKTVVSTKECYAPEYIRSLQYLAGLGLAAEAEKARSKEPVLEGW